MSAESVRFLAYSFLFLFLLSEFSNVFVLRASWALDVHLHNVLVIAHYIEDLTWVLNFASKNSLNWNIIIYSKQPKFAFATLSTLSSSSNLVIKAETENWGDEALPYLHYIVSNYEDLPPLLVFVHGEPFAHTPFLLDYVACLNPSFSGYFPLGSLHVEMSSPFGDQWLSPPFDEFFATELIAQNLTQFIPLKRPHFSNFYASAQFVVSRSAIQRRPLKYWKALLTTAENVRNAWPLWSLAATGREGKASAFWLEFTWHEHFTHQRGEKWIENNIAILGNEGNSSLPILRSCSEQAQHSQFSSMLRSKTIERNIGSGTIRRCKSGNLLDNSLC
jgi:hypothetical protein